MIGGTTLIIIQETVLQIIPLVGLPVIVIKIGRDSLETEISREWMKALKILPRI